MRKHRTSAFTNLAGRQAAMRRRLYQDYPGDLPKWMCPICYAEHQLPEGIPENCWRVALTSRSPAIERDFKKYLDKNKLGIWKD